MAYLAYGMAWVSTAIATSVGIYYTKDVDCLWAMLIPAMISISFGSKDKTNNKA